jgi:hypothetical protein
MPDKHIALLDAPAILRPNSDHARTGTTAHAGRATANDALGMAVVRTVPAPRALACAVAVILWGPDASSDRLRACARCSSCVSKGATLQRPGWAFPTDE